MSPDKKKTVPRMRELYRNQVVPALMTKTGLKNVMQVPRLDKIVLNMGIGKAVQDSKLIDEAAFHGLQRFSTCCPELRARTSVTGMSCSCTKRHVSVIYLLLQAAMTATAGRIHGMRKKNCSCMFDRVHVAMGD